MEGQEICHDQMRYYMHFVRFSKFAFPFRTFLTSEESVAFLLWKYRVIQNDCRGFNNLSYTIHLR